MKMNGIGAWTCLGTLLLVAFVGAGSAAPGGNGGGPSNGGGGKGSNTAPTAAFTFSCTSLDCSFDATSSSDAESADSKLTFTWAFDDGSTGSGIQTSHIYGSGGSYAVALTVTDPRGLSDTDTQTVTVTAPPPPPNTAPTASFTFSCTDLDCSFDGTASSDAETTDSELEFAWTFGDGTIASGTTVSRTYAAAGTYSITLAVTDPGGLSDSETVSVTLAAPPSPNTEPVASFTASCENLECYFDGSASSDAESDDSALTFEWSFGDGTTATEAAPILGYTYASSGTYTIALTVTDPPGLADTETETVSVTAPSPPVAQFDFLCSFMTCYFDGRASSDAETSAADLFFVWDFGDNYDQWYASTPEHSYLVPGQYVVTLTVWDSSELSDTTRHIVDVCPVPVSVQPACGGPPVLSPPPCYLLPHEACQVDAAVRDVLSAGACSLEANGSPAEGLACLGAPSPPVLCGGSPLPTEACEVVDPAEQTILDAAACLADSGSRYCLLIPVLSAVSGGCDAALAPQPCEEFEAFVYCAQNPISPLDSSNCIDMTISWAAFCVGSFLWDPDTDWIGSCGFPPIMEQTLYCLTSGAPQSRAQACLGAPPAPPATDEIVGFAFGCVLRALDPESCNYRFELTSWEICTLTFLTPGNPTSWISYCGFPPNPLPQTLGPVYDPATSLGSCVNYGRVPAFCSLMVACGEIGGCHSLPSYGAATDLAKCLEARSPDDWAAICVGLPNPSGLVLAAVFCVASGLSQERCSGFFAVLGCIQTTAIANKADCLSIII